MGRNRGYSAPINYPVGTLLMLMKRTMYPRGSRPDRRLFARPGLRQSGFCPLDSPFDVGPLDSFVRDRLEALACNAVAVEPAYVFDERHARLVVETMRHGPSRRQRLSF